MVLEVKKIKLSLDRYTGMKEWRKEIADATNVNAEAIAELETRTNVTHAANVRDKLWKQINDNAKAIIGLKASRESQHEHIEKLTDKGNANVEAINSYYELSKTALNAHAKLKKRVENLEDIKDGLELDKELHQGSSTTIPLDEYAKKREQSDTQQEGFYRCHDCGHGPFAITEKVCDSCGGEAFDFVPDKPAQQEGYWKCTAGCGNIPESELFDGAGCQRHRDKAHSGTSHRVKLIPSPTETPASVYTDWGKQDTETPEVEHAHTVSETDACIQAVCSECGERIAPGADRVKVTSFQHRNCAGFGDEFLAEVKAVETPEAEAIAAWNRRAGTESTHYYEPSKLKNHSVEPSPSFAETLEAEEPDLEAKLHAAASAHKSHGFENHEECQICYASKKVLELRKELVTCRVVIANQIGLIDNKDKEIDHRQAQLEWWQGRRDRI